MEQKRRGMSCGSTWSNFQGLSSVLDPLHEKKDDLYLQCFVYICGEFVGVFSRISCFSVKHKRRGRPCGSTWSNFQDVSSVLDPLHGKKDDGAKCEPETNYKNDSPAKCEPLINYAKGAREVRSCELFH